jgi:hypothetical protein
MRLLEDPDMLKGWVREACDVALRKKVAPKKKGKR